MAPNRKAPRAADDLVDWFTISYKSIYLAVFIVVGAGAAFYYSFVKNAVPPPPPIEIVVTEPTAHFSGIEGTVKDRSGKPAPGVIVYAYHTDARGIYPREEHSSGGRHGRLRGWAKTDGKGDYRFDTIRPAGYPDTDIPSHVHMHVIEVGRCTYYIDDLLFDDDPRLSAEERNRRTGRGGNGIAVPRKDAAGTWLVRRDIVLGQKVPGYPGDQGKRR